MAKRFRDTKIWNKPWYRKMGSQNRDIWQWLYDHCEAYGVWEKDFESMSFDLGFEVTMTDVERIFGDRITHIEDNKIYFNTFVAFQYGDERGRLSEDNRVHMSIIKQLDARNLPFPEIKPSKKKQIPGPGTAHVRPVDGPKDKDKVKDKDIEKELERELEEKFEVFWQAWPNKADRTPAFKAFKKHGGPLTELLTALEKYKRLKPDWQGWMHGQTFINSHKDILRPDYGQASARAVDADKQRRMSGYV